MTEPSENPVNLECVFCEIVKGKSSAKVVARWARDAIAIVPLNPVVEGHVIVIPCQHVDHALQVPAVTGRVMAYAAELATGPCNIITSVGVEATQSIQHLHIHVVPRKANDGLKLPWSVLSGTGEAECPTGCGEKIGTWIKNEAGDDTVWTDDFYRSYTVAFDYKHCPDCGCLLKPEDA